MRSQHPLSGFREDIPLVRGLSSHHYTEKRFLYLLLLSIVLHGAGFAIWYLWPEDHRQTPPEATFIDLQDMPQLKPPVQGKQPDIIRPSDQRRRVDTESAPRSTRSTPPVRTAPRIPSSRPSTKTFEPGTSASELLRRKPKQQTTDNGTTKQPNLMPSSSRMARIEESYRRRFADDVDEGSTRFLNTDDIQFGSFLRRFETAVYGVWRYPQEAALKGIEGMTPVKITFNRNGEIVKVLLLESSGSRVLDDEVFRTLRLVGPMGNLPKSYGKDEFNLIAFFQYGNARGRLR